MPSVTILVPIYNVAAYIAECAASLFSQSYADIEYIFCDDCSPDNSVAILSDALTRYPHRAPHVTVLRNMENKGLGGSRLHLIQHVTTPYFIHADSDDILPPDAVATLVEAIERTGADYVEGAYTEYNRGSHSAPFRPFHGTEAAYRRRVLCQNIVGNHVWGKIYRNSVLTLVPQPFIPGIDYAEDLCFNARLAAVATRASIDNVVYHYRTDNITSYTKNISRRSVLSYVRASDTIYRFYLSRHDIPLSLEIGILNVYRECQRNTVPLSDADALLSYTPHSVITHITRCLLRSRGIAYTIGDILYRVARLLCSRF